MDGLDSADRRGAGGPETKEILCCRIETMIHLSTSYKLPVSGGLKMLAPV